MNKLLLNINVKILQIKNYINRILSFKSNKCTKMYTLLLNINVKILQVKIIILT